jgi:hypothetical protein
MSYWDRIKKPFGEVSVHDSSDAFLRTFSQLPIYVGDLLATHWALSEISNGGLHQLFRNPTGVLVPEAVQGFERMGLSDVADLIRRAMTHFGQVYPREQRERLPFLVHHGPEVFELLERKLYDVGAPDLGRIYDVMDHYAQQNAA